MHLKATVWFCNTNQVCHVWLNSLPGYTCQTTVVFGTLKDDSLQITNLALANCFSYRNVFQNDVNALSKKGAKNPSGFLSKNSKFRVVWTIRFCLNLTCLWSKHFVRNVWRDFRQCQYLQRQIYCKRGFFHRAFYVTIADADIEGLKSLHSLFYKDMDHMLVKFEQNRTVQTVQKFELLPQNGLPVLTNFGRRFCDWNNCLRLNFWFKLKQNCRFFLKIVFDITWKLMKCIKVYIFGKEISQEIY